MDACGFVVDFGNLKPLREWIDQNLDHACVFNRDDPLLDEILKINDTAGCRIYKPCIVDQCSSEGLAKHMFDVVDPMIQEITSERAFLISVVVTEDARNSATYKPVER